MSVKHEGISEPSKRWWLQRSFVFAEGLGVLLLVAGLLVAISSWSDYARGLIGGALFGLAGALIVGSAFTTHGQWAQLERDYQIWTESTRATLEPRIRAINAYYLGVLSKTFPESAADIPSRLVPIRYFCRYFRVTFAAAEFQLLTSDTVTVPEATKISEMIRLSFQRDMPLDLLSFFKLGRLIGSLTRSIESMRPIEQTVTAIGSLAENPFIGADREFAKSVAIILGLMVTFDETRSDRARLVTELDQVLRGLPGPIMEPFEISDGSPEFEWIWIDDGGHLRPAGMADSYLIVALGDWSYSVSRSDKSYRAEVFRVGMSWGCSQHSEADQDAPCLDMQLIFDHTGGGTPVTEASLYLVRWTDDGQLEVLEV